MSRIAFLAPTILAACVPAVPPNLAAPQVDPIPVTQGSLAFYACDDGQTIGTRLAPGRVALTLGDGTPLDLPLIQTPGGPRYAADGWIWFTDGDRAILTQQGGQTNCALDPAAAAIRPVG
jgi:membrane-bound inhibitor of C-type lysozyme